VRYPPLARSSRRPLTLANPVKSTTVTVLIEIAAVVVWQVVNPADAVFQRQLRRVRQDSVGGCIAKPRQPIQLRRP
jgi:hypothetical protein